MSWFLGKKVILIGAGGHAKVLAEAIRLNRMTIEGATCLQASDFQLAGSQIAYLGADEIVLKQYRPGQVLLVNGVGSVKASHVRKKIFERFKSKGYSFASIIHPSATVGQDGVCLGEGVQILAGAVIQPGCRIGNNVILNTRASADHDCEIASHAHIAPGTTLCGHVRVGECSHIGAGATVLQNVTIPSQITIGAHSLVTRTIEEPTASLYFGIPVKPVPEVPSR